jgi:hypothetical protein
VAICKPEPDRVDPTGLAYKGSMLQMQLYANEHADVLSAAAAEALRIPVGIEWVSPREDDSYAEYRDAHFLQALGLQRFGSRLESFWPRRGPCWDGLGRWSSDSRGTGVVLVEAKSYPDEARSTMSAKAPGSRRMIEEALDSTAERLGLSVRPDAWVEGRYQTANRLAHLHFLREVCGVDAGLLFLLVVNDPTHVSTSLEAWQQAWTEMRSELGLEAAPPQTAAAFLPGLPRPGPSDGR